MFARTIEQQLQDEMGKPGSVIILSGPRQAGKSTMVKRMLENVPNAISFTSDDLHTQSLLSRHELEHLQRIVGSATTIFIDEAQRIDNIGLTLKLLADNLPATIIASGSVSFVNDRVSAPLAGRIRTFHLHPLSWEEVALKYPTTPPDKVLEQMLRFGMYPRVHTMESDQEKEEYLYTYLNHFLYHDLLEFEQVKKPKKVVDLLVLLAQQIGKEVAIYELSSSLGLSQKTVENYLDILEKMFLIVNLRGFSRNLRKEVTKTSRYYFADLGLRNALMRSFEPLSQREDVEELFENWFIMERIKHAGNHNRCPDFYFWRTYDLHGIDLVEDIDGQLTGFECKWSPKARAKVPKDWTEGYPGAGFELITQATWKQWL